jgi:hypothetical protein
MSSIPKIPCVSISSSAFEEASTMAECVRWRRSRRSSTTTVEDILLERSERFWSMIAGARRGKPIANRRIAEAGQRTAVGAWPDGSFALSPPRTVI